MSHKIVISEKRQAQLREAQRRRREKLSTNDRHQVNLFLSKQAIRLMDAKRLISGMDRHDLVEQLILNLQSKAPPKSK